MTPVFLAEDHDAAVPDALHRLERRRPGSQPAGDVVLVQPDLKTMAPPPISLAFGTYKAFRTGADLFQTLNHHIQSGPVRALGAEGLGSKFV